MNHHKSESHRMACLGAFAFQMGFIAGPLIHRVIEVDPSILVQALLYTAIAFTSFSAISLFSKRRSYLYLGSIIMTLVNCMIVYRLCSWIFGYSSFNIPYLLFGLFVTSLYIIFDTQLIVEKAEAGDKDVPTHTLMLFIDLFDLFIKILTLLIKLNENKKDNKRKN
jgi:FtsH-binding integral membrane protein